MKVSQVLFILLFLIATNELFAQGCVAVRHFGGCAGPSSNSNILKKGEFMPAMNYRYFKSFRHFRGIHEEPDRLVKKTEVINYSHALDISLSYGICNRVYGIIVLPFVYNERSSLYEHGGLTRKFSHSSGLADIRIGAGYWLFDPETSMNGNLAIGLGVKLPTGNYAATDEFYNLTPARVTQIRSVDQSIQPGDGGLGLTVDLQGSRRIVSNLLAYGTAFYLVNPRETNGTRTFRETLSPLLVNEAIMSVPDQYSARAGFAYMFNSIHTGLSLGGRYEGVPVNDLIGGSKGFRRPGSILSIEPGLTYMKGKISTSLTVPFAMRRERPQSVTDLEIQKATGVFRQGDAAFADYLINFSIAYRISKKSSAPAPASTPAN